MSSSGILPRHSSNLFENAEQCAFETCPTSAAFSQHKSLATAFLPLQMSEVSSNEIAISDWRVYVFRSLELFRASWFCRNFGRSLCFVPMKDEKFGFWTTVLLCPLEIIFLFVCYLKFPLELFRGTSFCRNYGRSLFFVSMRDEKYGLYTNVLLYSIKIIFLVVYY